MNTGTDSLYSLETQPVVGGPDPRPHPGTIETSSFETIDNDRAALLLDAGMVR